MLLDAALILLAYLVGSISTAIIVCRALGLTDPRSAGSGNPGATNVVRLHGTLPGVLTLIGDFLKGFVPVLLANRYGSAELTPALTALAAFLGHLYPLFFGFRGGKGVATAFGAVLALSWQVGVICLVVWIAVFALSRISGLASLSAFLALPIATLLGGHPPGEIVIILIMTLLTFWRHGQNIRELIERFAPDSSKD